MKFKYIKNIDKTMKYFLKYGGFLTCKDGDDLNVMTINWGTIGNQWGKPVFTMMVRKSRSSHNIIENSNEFTVSIPTKVEYRRLLGLCGSSSYKDVNKIEKFNIKLKDSVVIDTPSIDGCTIFYECKVIYKYDVKAEDLNNEIEDITYMEGDYHTIYVGEIVNYYVEGKNND